MYVYCNKAINILNKMDALQRESGFSFEEKQKEAKLILFWNEQDFGF